MDESKYVELEAKYEARSIPISDFEAAMAMFGGSYKSVVGIDTFFSDGAKVLRYRRPRQAHEFHCSDKSELTYKKRRRNGDISDRTEVNLSLAATASEQDVRAHLEVMGMKEHFTILKESWIQHVPVYSVGGIIGTPSFFGEGIVGMGSGFGGEYIDDMCIPFPGLYSPPAVPKIPLYTAVFALYDVLSEGKIRRFLEIEIERDELLSVALAQDVLKEKQEWIAKQWPEVGAPLKTSLYEMYAPRNDLFIPESF